MSDCNLLADNYTKFPNFYIDKVLPYLKPDEVLCLITAYRLIWGWQLQKGEISVQTFQDNTKLSKPRVSRALRALIRYRLLIVEREATAHRARVLRPADKSAEVRLDLVMTGHQEVQEKNKKRASNAKHGRSNLGTEPVPQKNKRSGTEPVPIIGTEPDTRRGTEPVPPTYREKKVKETFPKKGAGAGVNGTQEQAKKEMSEGRQEALAVLLDQVGGQEREHYKIAMPVWGLAAEFEQLTGIDRPGFDEIDDRRLTDREMAAWKRDWCKPLLKMSQAGGDDTAEILGDAIKHFRAEGLGYSHPGSFLKTVKRWAKDRSLGHPGNGNGGKQVITDTYTGESGGRAYQPSAVGLHRFGA